MSQPEHKIKPKEADSSSPKEADSSSMASGQNSNELDVNEFRGDADETNHLERSPSMLQKMQTRLSIFNDKLKEARKKILIKYLLIYALMAFLMLGIFSIYWGTGFEREERYHRLRMLVVIEDVNVVNDTQPVIGNSLRELLESPEARNYGGWLIQNNTEFNESADRHGNSAWEEVMRQVHHQEYWAGVYVRANASNDLKNAILSGDTSYNVSSETVRVYYETGRDMMSMNSYVTPNVQKMSSQFAANTSYITTSLMSSEDLSNVFANQNALTVASTPLQFSMEDARPWTDPVLFAPSQVGLIYLIILTFFAFNFFNDVHSTVARLGIKTAQLVLYRALSSIISFFVLSLIYSLVTLAFQVDFEKTFGRSGFLVYWMTNFLTMWAVGAMNEVMAMWCIMIYPPVLGFWMLFWVIINISPTFTPMAILPKFYRYGYGLPVHASYEITKVIFFDTYKGAMGRNYGILIAWDAFATISLIVTFKIFGQKMGGKARAERERLKEEVREEIQNEESVEDIPRDRN
ncbi:uncharacterized protein CXQ87_000677 [Candidozyma duobushaemuli]|uniref:DUF3533 domain-containing protein n=2 Tax=Candidozyma TaxID=3303203 RepID=A0ABX8I5C9_9ASCO|nr:uncharacterized protein CXQ87_000677 [[Candida] duobushaemulonis]PVH17781.1 hypothetical protein CXQ87_000677 [[Candida] duobushaemulonis]QWU86383.1 hypothetical protein CA3LBN_000601 [[Candida] haemuloni]